MRADRMTGSGHGLAGAITAATAWMMARPWLIWWPGGVAIMLLAAIPFATDLIVLNRATVDFTYPLDTALRWAYGHWPHRDYQTPVGIAYWALQGAAGAMLSLSAKAIFLANLMAALVIGLAGTVLIRRRLAASHATLLIIGLLGLVLSPRMFGDPAGLISYLAPYNKTGLAILGFLLVAYFVPPRDGVRGVGIGLETIVAGLLITWLIYLKLNFAALAVVGAIAALYFAPANRNIAVGSILLASVAAAAIAAMTGIAGAYMSDIRTVAEVGDVFRPTKLVADLIGSVTTLVLFAVALIAYRLSSNAAIGARRRNLVIAFGLIGACIAAMNQVHGNALPIAFVAIIVLSERALREASRPHLSLAPHVVPWFAALLLVLLPITKDLRTLGTYISDQEAARAIPFCTAADVPACTVAYAYFDAHALDTLSPFPNPVLRTTPAADSDIAAQVAQSMTIEQHLDQCQGAPLCALWSVYDELYALLNLVMRANDRPYLLGFMNPIPYYYGVEPPKFVPAWIDMGRTLSAAAHPDATTMFSDVTLLIVPKTELAQDYRPGLFAIYENDIRTQFAVVAETESWSIWRRTP